MFTAISKVSGLMLAVGTRAEIKAICDYIGIPRKAYTIKAG